MMSGFKMTSRAEKFFSGTLSVTVMGMVDGDGRYSVRYLHIGYKGKHTNTHAFTIYHHKQQQQACACVLGNAYHTSTYPNISTMTRCDDSYYTDITLCLYTYNDTAMNSVSGRRSTIDSPCLSPSESIRTTANGSASPIPMFN